MSEQIDWSKAPEGATHRGAINWFKSDGEKVYTFDGAVWNPVSWEIWQLAPFAKRQSIHADEWSGEGLPPVGMVCEVRCIGGGWGAATIKYISPTQCVWLWVSDNEDQSEFAREPWKLEFRPIRTHEQIAADERDKAAHELFRTAWPETHSWGDLSPHWQEAFYRLTDAGFRKP